jgi:hypothetical protein
MPLGQEVNPLAIRTPKGGEAVDPVAGELPGGAVFHAVKADLPIEVAGGRDVSQPLAVGRPMEIAKPINLNLSNLAALFFLEV